MEHMEKEALVKLLCAPYCSFYKPGKDEELACNGFSVLMKLAATGLEVTAPPEKGALQEQTEDELFGSVCLSCSFAREDCDFASWRRGEQKGRLRKEMNPCGGFLFLGLCIDQGALDIQAINRVI